ncbi:MAG TPA: acyltransferase, partial [Candidatus Aenigmarchaeota archaeon]|nr:acyltransferase [Candidatus Aenigmarchaeota archaeon]
MWQLINLVFSFISFLRKKKKGRYLQQLISNGLKLGENVMILDNVWIDPSHCYLITIGNNCVLAPNVKLIAHDASTKKYLGYTKIGRIIIGDNCFIGAGSVVTHDIPPNSIAAGNPARVICSLSDFFNKKPSSIETAEKSIYERLLDSSSSVCRKTERDFRSYN